MARPYRPSGKSEPGALMRLALAATAVAALVGIVEGVVGFLGFSLLLVFPAVIGFAAGAVGARIVQTGKIRAPGSAALAVGVAALLGQGLTHVASYAMWRHDARGEVVTHRDQLLANPELDAAERGELEALDPDVEVDQFLVENTGQGGLAGYLRFAAAAGVSIDRVGSSSEDQKPTLTGTGTYVLWGAEFAVALLVAFAMAYSRAREPFCELCRAWYGRTDVIAVGNGKKQQIQQMIRALESGDFGNALSTEVLGEPTAALSSVVTLHRCQTCEEHEPLLTVKQLRQSRGKVQTADKYKTLVRADEARLLTGLAEARAAAVAEAEVAQQDA